jgi:hypothetical protein
MRSARLFAAAFAALLSVNCASTQEKVTVYSPGGAVADETVKRGDRVIAELRRVFDTTVIRGEGLFEHDNEGLARQSALSLAQSDLAQKVQSEVRGNTVVMNNADVRSVVETSVNAVIRNYDIDSAGYDPNSKRYRVRISIKGEQLVKEIERRRSGAAPATR